MFRNDTPLFLPEGSVRAILALLVIGLVATGLLDEQLALLALGFYFGSRTGAEKTP